MSDSRFIVSDLFATLWTVASSVHEILQAKNTGVDCHFSKDAAKYQDLWLLLFLASKT